MEDMGGKWAVPGYDTKKYGSLQEANAAKDSYGYQVVSILNEILGTTEEKEKEPVKEPEQEVTKEENTKPLKGRKICLDPGHYAKYNRCPGIPEYYESEVMWKFHLLLKKELEALGATVITTRANANVDVGLVERGQMSKGCDAFLSLHTNAVGSAMNETVDYVAVYHLSDDATTYCDDVSKEIANKIAPVIANVMGTGQGFRVLTRNAVSDRNGDGFSNDNYYGVLHGARLADTPGLILEHSFHTNSKVVRWLLQDANLERLAKAEAQCLAEYFSGVEIKDNTSSGLPYQIRVANVSAGSVLNVRKEPSTNATIVKQLQYNDPNRYTIVEEQNGWGKLKSGIGWVYLQYTKRV